MSTTGVAVTFRCEDFSCSDSESGSEISNSFKKEEPGCPSSPLLSHSNNQLKEVVSIIPCSPSVQSFRLSDAHSIISAEEINHRREALRLFSSQLSMSSSLRSTLAIPGSASNQLIQPQGIPPTANYEQTPFSSTMSSLAPFCRICQATGEPDNVLIYPCRCDGSMKYIHGTCLRKWIEVCERKHKYTGPAFCELCGYIYRKHKFFKCSNWQWPKIATKDKILHSIFLASLVLMVGCAVATVMCFTTDQSQLKQMQGDSELGKGLTTEELITIICGVTFFVSFFVSISVELKTKHAIHEIIKRCIRHNTIWLIENYSRANDYELQRQSQSGGNNDEDEK